MTATLSIQAEARDKTGKSISRSLRREDKIPAIVYGKGQKEMLISLLQKEANGICSKLNATTTVVDLNIGKSQHKVIAKQFDLHPITDSVRHIEFMFLGEKGKASVKVPVLVVGIAESVDLKRNGILNRPMRFINCLVDKNNIPEYIEVDVANMSIGEKVRLKDLAVDKSVTIQEADMNQVVLKMTGKKTVKEETESSDAEDTSSEAAEGKSKEDESKESEPAK